jgi:hypothetical protein
MNKERDREKDGYRKKGSNDSRYRNPRRGKNSGSERDKDRERPRDRDSRGRDEGRSGRGRDRDEGRGRGRSTSARGRGGPRRRDSYDSGSRRGSADKFKESGNQRERIAVESGSLVLIDQFMLANEDFIGDFIKVIDEETDKKEEVILRYGGIVLEVPSGTYKIDRDPQKFQIIIHKEDFEPEDVSDEDDETSESGATDKQHEKTVYLDTRCVAMIDRELLDDSSLLEKYQQLWFSGQDKACRDLLRDNGGAVRYGFSRFHEDLKLAKSSTKDVVVLKSDAEASVASD